MFEENLTALKDSIEIFFEYAFAMANKEERKENYEKAKEKYLNAIFPLDTYFADILLKLTPYDKEKGIAIMANSVQILGGNVYKLLNDILDYDGAVVSSKLIRSIEYLFVPHQVLSKFKDEGGENNSLYENFQSVHV